MKKKIHGEKIRKILGALGGSLHILLLVCYDQSCDAFKLSKI